MDQCVATILADGEIRARNHRFDLPGNLYAGISPHHVAHIEDQYRARSESGNWPQRWDAETRPVSDLGYGMANDRRRWRGRKRGGADREARVA
jgi:hypothetical protein